MLRSMASSSGVCAVAAILMMVTCFGCAPKTPPGYEVVESPCGTFLRPSRSLAVVYVIDRSGSMQKVFGLVREELLNSISNLTEEDRFHVILPADGEPLEKDPKRLTPGTDEHKGDAAVFLEGVEAEGQTDPLRALARAFEVLDAAPEEEKIIHLLSDGFPDNEAVRAMIAELNASGNVQVNTFVIGNEPVVHDAMERIAEESGGHYKHVFTDGVTSEQ